MSNWSGIGLMVIDLMQDVRRGRAGRKKVGQITGYQLGVFPNECTTGEAQNLYLLRKGICEMKTPRRSAAGRFLMHPVRILPGISGRAGSLAGLKQP